MICPTCDRDPCPTPAFCATCGKIDAGKAKKATNGSAQPTTPKDEDAIAADESRKWLNEFSKQSNDALAARASAKKESAPPPDEKAVIEELARKGSTEYDRLRKGVAEAFGIRRSTLDDKVDTRREELKDTRTEVAALYPHWGVAPWPEAVDGADLLQALVEQIRRYVVMQQWQAVVVALWILQAWAHEHAVHSPVLLVTSPEPNSGKSTLFGVLQFLTPRSLACVGLNEATLFRSVNLWAPTLLADEADTLFVDNEPLRAVFNSGWTRGTGVPRCVGDDHVPQMFSTFCPKAIGMKGKKLPATTLSRCIVVEMRRKLETEKAQDFNHLDNDLFAELRRKLVRWRDDNAKALINSEPVFPEGFHNRVRANWRMLLAIAEVAGDSWPTKAQEAASKAEAVVDTASVGTELLMAVRNVFDESGEHELSSATLVAKLTADPEGRWHEWKAGKPLAQKQLAGLLREYSISSETVHPRGGPDAKGYRRERFTDAWGRYLAPQQAPSGGNPDSEASKRPNADGSSTSRDFPSVLIDNPDASKKGNLSYSHAGLDAWTVQKAENGAKGDSATNGGRVPNDFDAVAEELAERGPVYAKVTIRKISPPAISAGPDDDLLDIDPGWRQ